NFTGYNAMQDANIGGVTERLENNAIPFGQAKQSSDLLLAGVGIQIDMQSNLLKPNGHILRDSESATKIDIALSLDRCVTQLDAESGGDCAQRDPGTSY